MDSTIPISTKSKFQKYMKGLSDLDNTDKRFNVDTGRWNTEKSVYVHQSNYQDKFIEDEDLKIFTNTSDEETLTLFKNLTISEINEKDGEDGDDEEIFDSPVDVIKNEEDRDEDPVKILTEIGQPSIDGKIPRKSGICSPVRPTHPKLLPTKTRKTLTVKKTRNRKNTRTSFYKTSRKEKTKQDICRDLKNQVWISHFGEVLKHKCFTCNTMLMINDTWHAGHVCAESKSGPLIIENIRPVCASCNKSMGTCHMYLWLFNNQLENNKYSGSPKTSSDFIPESIRKKPSVKILKFIDQTRIEAHQSLQCLVSTNKITDKIYRHYWKALSTCKSIDMILSLLDQIDQLL